jgi:hypothetical protein
MAFFSSMGLFVPSVFFAMDPITSFRTADEATHLKAITVTPASMTTAARLPNLLAPAREIAG